MKELNELLRRQHREYRNRMNYLAAELGWKWIPGYILPLMRGRR